MLKQKHNFPKQDDIFQNKNYIPNPRRKMCIVLTQLQNIVSVSEFAFPRRIRRVVFRISRFELEERFCSEITSSTFGTSLFRNICADNKRRKNKHAAAVSAARDRIAAAYLRINLRILTAASLDITK